MQPADKNVVRRLLDHREPPRISSSNQFAVLGDVSCWPPSRSSAIARIRFALLAKKASLVSSRAETPDGQDGFARFGRVQLDWSDWRTNGFFFFFNVLQTLFSTVLSDAWLLVVAFVEKSLARVSATLQVFTPERFLMALLVDWESLDRLMMHWVLLE